MRVYDTNNPVLRVFGAKYLKWKGDTNLRVQSKISSFNMRVKIVINLHKKMAITFARTKFIKVE